MRQDKKHLEELLDTSRSYCNDGMNAFEQLHKLLKQEVRYQSRITPYGSKNPFLLSLNRTLNVQVDRYLRAESGKEKEIYSQRLCGGIPGPR